MAGRKPWETGASFVESELEKLHRQSRLLSEHLPTTRLLSEELSPSAKLMHDQLQSLTQSPASLEAQRIFDKYEKAIRDDPLQQQARKLLADLDRRHEEDRKYAKLAVEFALGRDTVLSAGTASIDAKYRELITSATGTSTLENSVAAIVSKWSTADPAGVLALGGGVEAAVRAHQWASVIGVSSPDIFRALYPHGGIAVEVDRVQRAAAEMLAASTPATTHMTAALGLAGQYEADLTATRVKLAAFAGATDMLGYDARTSQGAYESLFGRWQTANDLPESFWRDNRTRKRMYRRADVDEGLIDASPSVALDVVIESGLASGVRADGGTLAIVPAGRFSMSIRSTNTRVDTYEVVSQFEIELREFISRKLYAKDGPDWFKSRVDGNTAGNAKRIRKAALQNDEQMRELIHFTELGDLVNIIVSPRNWSDVFGDVFKNRDKFVSDMGTLLAARRPAAHSRPIDGVRLVEVIIVAARLSTHMEQDGAWLIDAESEA